MICFTTLTHLSLLTRLENVKLPSNDTDVAPPYVVRAIFMYGRSYSMPVYKSNLDVSVFGWICVTLSRVTDVRLTVLQSCVHFVSASSSALLGGIRFAPFTQIEMGMQEVWYSDTVYICCRCGRHSVMG